MRRIIIYLFLFLAISVVRISAQTPAPGTDPFSKADGAATLGVARVIEILDKDPKDGAIISAGDKGAVLSSTPYDSQVLGVVARDAAIIMTNSNTPGGVPVISNGAVYVLVSSKQGNLKKGDMVATSSMPGVGVKAVDSGYIIGNVLEDYSSTDTNAVGKIAIDLDLHYYNAKPTMPGSLSDILKIVFFPTKQGPSPFFKYIVAALIVLGSFILGFMTFGRAAAKGIEALGRNPAAKSIIQLGIIFNVVIVVAIVAAGLTVAFLILRL
jgi:F0F1-type ATP synthase membrane subunit c/vacuolar-type H+-ATPase subunit K